MTERRERVYSVKLPVSATVSKLFDWDDGDLWRRSIFRSGHFIPANLHHGVPDQAETVPAIFSAQLSLRLNEVPNRRRAPPWLLPTAAFRQADLAALLAVIFQSNEYSHQE